jgi:hypothetical protein
MFFNLFFIFKADFLSFFSTVVCFSIF